MGLDANGIQTGASYHGSYSRLHLVRYLAARSLGWYGDWIQFNEEMGVIGNRKNSVLFRSWVREYPALMHHSDTGGAYVPRSWLIDVDYSESYSLGNVHQLYDELVRLERWLTEHREANKFDTTITASMRDAFTAFWSMVKTEVEADDGYPHGTPIIVFH